jgi:hypothetical protein
MYRISVADYTYIGSTLDFKQRKRAHKSDCKSKELNIYQVMRDNGGWDNCEMIPIEEYECENNTQARIREEYWRREYGAKMNSIKAYRTEQEKKDYRKQHYINTKETLKEKITCECGSIICKCDISKHLKTKKHLAFVASNTNQEYNSCDNAFVL